jgi:hypothetical protein
VFRTFVLLAIGVAIGYTYGFKDARRHEKMVVERLLDRAGASARGKYRTDLDRQAAMAER